ncbi:MAG TPA: M42 family peptidase [Caldisericia bacterium]|nr:M42 family peptidase [Caldisericia bacterium]HPF48110.1 M42 family peptidase [Caldisericia bacterium]HPI83953.1 M42 family peptidase [Caldisericia bacterium]HPQ92563.1 M42 family peptidase [Caldisericia bacterium]HRV74339.1 M42 family peptidase [Caldisericia bacterium]
MELLERLSNAFGPPSKENEIRDIITNEVKSRFGLEPHTDHIGNLSFIKPGKPGMPRIMLDAHMDEVGLIVIGHGSGGELLFKGAGGLDPRVLPGKVVLLGKDKIPGVIGVKPPHTQKREEWNVSPTIEGLAIDVGAKDKKEAESFVPKYTVAMFDTKFENWGNTVKGKSFDDRIGCWAIIKTLEHQTDCEIVASFSMGEEIGMRGAKRAVRYHKPDLMIALEGTAAGDLPEVAPHMVCTRMGDGPVITFEDRSIIIPRDLRQKLEETAKQNDIPYQYKSTVTGGTNAGIMQYENGGTKCLVMAVGCRYIHSPVSLAAKSDAVNMVKLTKNFISRIDRKEIVL